MQENSSMIDIEISDFVKNYDDVQAVRGVSLSVQQGELFGLIGPDGAGKTSLMRAVCTLLNPDSGFIRVKGYDTQVNIREIRGLLGYMPQRFSLYQDLTVEQNLQFFADLFQVPAAERQTRLKQLYSFSRLEPFKKRQAGALSGGMKQKLALSCALVHTPEVLVLDEPTFGVDPVSRKEFWDILRSIQAGGTTILVSTAYMDEADQCDRVALFLNGRIQAVDTPKQLKQSYSNPLYLLQASDLRSIRNYFRQQKNVLSTQLFGDSLHITFSEDPPQSFWEECRKNCEGELSSWKRIEPDIQDVFLGLMEE